MHPLTAEQETAVSGFLNRHALRVVAYAGAGKTSTLTAMARTRPNEQGIYIAFNRGIADEASLKFAGSSVQARTAHSLAFRHALQWGFAKEKLSTSLTSRMMRDLTLHTLAGPFRPYQSVGPVDGGTILQLITGTLRRFYHSADDEIFTRHVPRPAKPLDPDLMDEVRNHCALAAQIIWHYQAQAVHPLPMGHDGYLKVWALSRPRLDRSYSFVMADEAQDLNPVLIGIIRDQQCQVVSVGDSHQQIYAWRGAVDALKQLGGHELRLTQSFRFGTQIARFADQLLKAMGETHELRGNGRDNDMVRSPGEIVADAILCRTNAAVIDNLADLIGRDLEVHIAGGTSDLMRLLDDAARLKQGRPAESADLLGFQNWGEVQEFAESDEGGSVKVFVRLVDQHGVGRLRMLLGACRDRSDGADVTLSTAHKAKGLEWDSVELCSDFLRHDTEEGAGVNLAERRLFYVAATRAKQLLLVDAKVAAPYLRRMTVEELAAA